MMLSESRWCFQKGLGTKAAACDSGVLLARFHITSNVPEPDGDTFPEQSMLFSSFSAFEKAINLETSARLCIIYLIIGYVIHYSLSMVYIWFILHACFALELQVPADLPCLDHRGASPATLRDVEP